MPDVALKTSFMDKLVASNTLKALVPETSQKICGQGA